MATARPSLAGSIVQFITSDQPYLNLRADALQALRMLPNNSIDTFVSDPPYGIDLRLGTTRNARSIAGDGKTEARKLWRAFVPEAHRAAKPDSAHIFFGTWKSPWMHSVLSHHFSVRGCIAWNKRMFGLGYYLRPQWELAFFCVKGKPPRALKVPGDVWEHTRETRPLHPCQKPITLLRRAVALVARPGDLVCDPFAGIGSTGVAAVAERCRFLGIEICARHAALGSRRIMLQLAEVAGSTPDLA
jgi:DNA modification methylase